MNIVYAVAIPAIIAPAMTVSIALDLLSLLGIGKAFQPFPHL